LTRAKDEGLLVCWKAFPAFSPLTIDGSCFNTWTFWLAMLIYFEEDFIYESFDCLGKELFFDSFGNDDDG